MPASIADPQSAFGTPDPWDYPSSQRTEYYSIWAPTSTPSVLQLHLLPTGHLVVQQQCEACHGSLWILGWACLATEAGLSEHKDTEWVPCDVI